MNFLPLPGLCLAIELFLRCLRSVYCVVLHFLEAV
jgi:hypothetical protein